MNVNRALELMDSGESQTVEFKESINVSCKEEGTKSLVAFANRDGGRVIFGVEDDGSLRGVQVGNDTLESLAEYVNLHTYPSLPVHIEEVLIAGKSIVIAESASDRPPVIGLYLFSGANLNLDDEVDATKLVALRRVGRTNQTVDLMWMRAGMSSDPKLRLGLGKTWLMYDDEDDPTLIARAWVEEGSATAHEIRFRTEPAIYQTDGALSDLPIPYKSGGQTFTSSAGSGAPEVHGWRTFGDLTMVYNTGDLNADLCLIAAYKDDAGLTWEARRSISHEPIDEADGMYRRPGKFTRRILTFPPKRIVQP